MPTGAEQRWYTRFLSGTFKCHCILASLNVYTLCILMYHYCFNAVNSTAVLCCMLSHVIDVCVLCILLGQLIICEWS